MCAIFGSFDRDKFEELAALNQYRGNSSWSAAHFRTGAFKHYRDGETVELMQLRKGFFEYRKDSFVKIDTPRSRGIAPEVPEMDSL